MSWRLQLASFINRLRKRSAWPGNRNRLNCGHGCGRLPKNPKSHRRLPRLLPPFSAAAPPPPSLAGSASGDRRHVDEERPSRPAVRFIPRRGRGVGEDPPTRHLQHLRFVREAAWPGRPRRRNPIGVRAPRRHRRCSQLLCRPPCLLRSGFPNFQNFFFWGAIVLVRNYYF